MRKHWPVFAILALALVLRVSSIANYPNGFTPDEASFAYDAYSLLHTGKDQWGYAWPLVLKSFGDYKAPLYSYFAMPFVGLFGLTKLAIRLPNALLGAASVWVVFVLSSELVKRDTALSKFKNSLPLIASFILAVSPWHVLLSRGAFEANLTTFLLPLGMFLFVWGLDNPKFMIWSATVFGINLFSYHSPRFVTPALVGLLILLYWSKLTKLSRKHTYSSTAVFTVFLGLAGFTFFQGAGARAQDINIFGGAGEAQAASRLEAIEAGVSPTVARLTHNKYLVIGTRFLSNYSQYFSPKFLFTHGPGESTYGMFPGRGVLYPIEAITLLAFVLFAFRNWRSKSVQILVAWLLLAPIPAALAAGVGYAANRTAIIMPAVQLASALGAAVIIFFLASHSRMGSRFVISLSVSILALFVFDFSRFWFSHYIEGVHGEAMLNGNLEAANWVVKNTEGKVFVSKRLSEPHIYFAFAGKIDPTTFQAASAEWDYEAVGRKFVDQLGSYSLDRYTFADATVLDEPHDYAYAVGFADEIVGYGQEVYESGSLDRKVIVVKL